MFSASFNSSGGSAARGSAARAEDLSLIPSRVKPMNLKLVFTIPCLTFNIKGTVWRTSRQLCLLCRWERRLAGFPHVGVINR